MAAEESAIASLKTQGEVAPGPSRLQSELAGRILRLLKEQGAGPGRRLVELELCEHFGVSRTPIRGALKQLAAQGLVEARANRGFVLLDPVTEAPVVESINPQLEEDRRLIAEIAKARNTGRLPDECAQQEICRQFNVKLPTAMRVLHQLSDLGLVERKPGNGWAFMPSIDSPRALAESYAFRQLVEPTLVLQPTFELDRKWLKQIKARHIAFRNRTWRNSLAVEFYEMNSNFHQELARCSGNRYLLSAVQRQIQLRTFLNYHWDYGVERVHDSIDEHMQIIEALENDDTETASILMHEHLQSSNEASEVNQARKLGSEKPDSDSN